MQVAEHSGACFKIFCHRDKIFFRENSRVSGKAQTELEIIMDSSPCLGWNNRLEILFSVELSAFSFGLCLEGSL